MENRPNDPVQPDSGDIPPTDAAFDRESAAASPPPIDHHSVPPPPISESPPISETPPLYKSIPSHTRPPLGFPPLVPNERSKDEQNWALAAHLTSLSTYIGIPGFIGPLVIYLIKKDTLPFASEQAREALNFQISLFIYVIVCFVLFFLVVPLFLLPVLGLVHIVCTILASLSVSEGRAYRYPMTLRLVK